jgi:hypothetical protein
VKYVILKEIYVYNARRKILPPFPKSIEEIQLILEERGV